MYQFKRAKKRVAITLHQCPSIAPHGVPLGSTYVKVTNELFTLVMFLQTYIFYRKIMQKSNVMIILILNGFNRESYEEIKMRQKNSYIVLSDQGFLF